MEYKHLHSSKTKASSEADDFKTHIDGIGPATERRLHDAGILTFAQLAAMSPSSVAPLVTGLVGMSTDRIANWIDQARKLTPADSKHRAMPSGNGQHYATFTIELLLDEDNNVRRTRAVHIQDGVEEAWADWEETRLVKFIMRHAALPQSRSVSTLPITTTVEPPLPVTAIDEPAPPVIETAQPVALVATAAETTTLTPTTPTSLSGTLRLPGLETILADVDDPRSMGILRHGRPFNVRLTLDLTEALVPDDTSLNYMAVVYAKGLNNKLHQTIGETYGPIAAEKMLNIIVEGMPLPQGIYCLEAVVTLALPPAEQGLIAHSEGSVLQIH